MERFDRELRDTADWTDWEENRAHRYAIERDERRYPVKQIISTATGIPVSDFSGGRAAGNANLYAASLIQTFLNRDVDEPADDHRHYQQ
jgi:hypothetical protein